MHFSKQSVRITKRSVDNSVVTLSHSSSAAYCAAEDECDITRECHKPGGHAL